LQKSRTAIGLKGNDGVVAKKERRGDDNSAKIAEVCLYTGVEFELMPRLSYITNR
jgi:hypothetical protein